MILPCGCDNKWQDKMYGKQMRVHNPMKKEGSYRCTVCGTVKQTTYKEKK